MNNDICRKTSQLEIISEEKKLPMNGHGNSHRQGN